MEATLNREHVGRQRVECAELAASVDKPPSPLPARRVQSIAGPSVILVLIASATIYTYAFVLPPLLLSHPRAVGLIHWVASPCGVGAVATLCACLYLDEGRVRTRRRLQPPLTPCKVCGVQRPAGAHHCRTCDICTVDFDHHCGVLGRCIAEGNRKAFIGLLATGAISLLSVGYVSGVGASQRVWPSTPDGSEGTGLARILSWWFILRYSPGLVFFPSVGAALFFFCSTQLVCLAAGLTLHTLTDREAVQQVRASPAAIQLFIDCARTSARDSPARQCVGRLSSNGR